MARIIINTWGSYGDVYPYLGLGIALRQRGHEAVLAMPEVYRDLVEREGLAFHPVRPDIDIYDRDRLARAMDPAHGSQFLFRELLAPHIADAYADMVGAADGADLIVTHPAALAGPIVAEERRIPWASSVLAPLSFFSVTDPVAPPQAPWLHGVLSRSTLASRAFLWLGQRVTADWAEPIVRFRLSRGLPARGNPLIEGQHSPHLVLAMFSTVLASPQSDWPPNVSITGPILYNAAHHEPVPEGLLTFLDAGDPPVVFTLGTSAVAAAGAFYDISAEVVERLGRRAVLLVGQHEVNRLKRAYRGVFAADFAPHAMLFARASAIVHQGGAGTLHQALASGCPMLVVPHAHDQPDNARRATALGVARVLYPTRYGSATLERELRLLLETPSYRQAAGQVAAIVRDEDGAARACEALEGLLAKA